MAKIDDLKSRQNVLKNRAKIHQMESSESDLGSKSVLGPKMHEENSKAFQTGGRNSKVEENAIPRTEKVGKRAAEGNQKGFGRMNAKCAAHSFGYHLGDLGRRFGHRWPPRGFQTPSARHTLLGTIWGILGGVLSTSDGQGGSKIKCIQNESSEQV